MNRVAHVDQMSRSLSLPGIPRRIISLVPSQSEFLWDLGLHEELVGITKFCIHPDEMFRTITRVGGTKKLDLQKIMDIKPDLIIGNKEENDQSQILELEKHFPVWMSDIITIADALDMMSRLSEITGRAEEGTKILAQVNQSLDACRGLYEGRSAAYFMWNDPYMIAGGQTFIGQMMAHLGFKNVIGINERYPIMTPEQLQTLAPSHCLLSSEPFPFNAHHQTELQKLLPSSQISLVDGEIFSWYGSRMILAADYIKKLRMKD